MRDDHTLSHAVFIITVLFRGISVVPKYNKVWYALSILDALSISTQACESQLPWLTSFQESILVCMLRDYLRHMHVLVLGMS